MRSKRAVRRQLNPQVQIAGRAAAGAGFAFAGDAHPRAVADAGRNPHVHGPRVAVVLERQAPGDALIGVLERERDLVLEVAALAAAPAAAAWPPRLAGIGRRRRTC